MLLLMRKLGMTVVLCCAGLCLFLTGWQAACVITLECCLCKANKASKGVTTHR